MAIGSDPEIGKTFGSCRDYTMEDWERWWAWMRENWGSNLMAGYATTIHNKNNRFYKKHDPKDDEIENLKNTIDELKAEIQRLSAIAKYE